MRYIPNENDKHIKLILDQAILDKYTKYYFLQHPRAKKVPIEKPRHPSINQWCILPRPQMNALKQKWKDLSIFLIKYNKLDNMMLDDLDVVCTTYMDTLRRTDTDAYTPKFIYDGWTEAGFIVDDDYKHLHSTLLLVDYDKNNSRTEFDIYYR